MRRHILTLILCIAVSLGFLFWANIATISLSNAKPPSNCKDCHSGAKAVERGLEDVYAKIDSLPFKHSIVEEEKCDLCHIIRGFKTGRTWELSSPDAQKEQVFFLKDLSWDRKYKVDLRIKDNSGKEIPTESVQFIPSQVSSSISNDQSAPLIKNVEVEEVRQKIFFEAVIRWETDELSNSVVEYGLTPQYGETVMSEKVFLKRHKVAIGGLKGGNQYHYRVLSRDIFGNINSSDDFILNTSEQVSKEEGVRGIDKSQLVVKEVSTFKTKETKDIYLKVVSDKPIRAYLTVNEPAEIDKHGFGLAPSRFSRIDACVRCHAQGASHPVGIMSKGPKTKIPAELPTVEGGIITCVTCHYAHGGNKRYFARLDFQRDMCMACHTGAPFI